MSFVETIVEQLAKSGFENITKPQTYDTSDNTFAKLLEKQLSAQEAEKPQNLLGEMGMPAGLIIEPYDPNNLNVINEPQHKFQNNIDISDVEIKDFKPDNYFESFMGNKQKDSPLMNLFMRYATNSYESHGRSFISNLTDLADGLTGRL